MRHSLRLPFLLATVSAVVFSVFEIPGTPSTSAPVASKTVIIVRHAEKGLGDPDNPSLTPKGQRRAKALARLLAAAKATHICASKFTRTQETVAPLAKAMGKKVFIYDVSKKDSVAEYVAKAPAGSVVVVAGHSNTVPDIVKSLGGTLTGVKMMSYGLSLADSEHDRMFVVTMPGDREKSAVSTVELRYGE